MRIARSWCRRIASALHVALANLGVVGARRDTATPTLTTVSSSAVPSSVFGQPVTFTAEVVMPGGASAAVDRGSVVFEIDAAGSDRILGPTRIQAGAASAAIVLDTGHHTIVARYTDTADPPGFEASQSVPLAQVVRPAQTTTTLTASPVSAASDADLIAARSLARRPPDSDPSPARPAAAAPTDPDQPPARVHATAPCAPTRTSAPAQAPSGADVTLTARVRLDPPADPIPPRGLDGTLSFAIDGLPMGEFALAGSYTSVSATGAVPDAVGIHRLTVAYSGDASTNPSAAALSFSVTAPPAPWTTAPSAPEPRAASAVPAGASATPSIDAQLQHLSSSLVKALRNGGLAALMSTKQAFTAPSAGVVEQRIYRPATPSSGGAGETSKSVLVACARRRCARAGTAALRLRPPSAGRPLTPGTRSLKLVVVTRFTPTDGKPLTVVRRVTVKARAHSHASTREGASGGRRTPAVPPSS